MTREEYSLVIFFTMKIDLNKQEIEELLVEIITGKKMFIGLDGEIYAVKFPTISNRDRARLTYAKTCKKLQQAGLPTIEDMKQIIKKHGLLPTDFYHKTERIKKQLESFDRAKEITNSDIQVGELQKKSEDLRRELRQLEIIEDSILENTIELKAEEVRMMYLLSCCTMHGEELDTQYWTTYKDFEKSHDKRFVMMAKQNFIIMMIGIDPSVIRALARTLEWRQRWKASKQTGASVFEGASASWDKNKVAICYWSDFYDDIYAYPQAPSAEIIEDDESLFDWIQQMNKRNKKGGDTPANGKSYKVDQPYKVRTSFDSL